MYKQTEQKYKSVQLGNGTGSLYDLGCYEISLCNGLVQKGYGYEPETLNEVLKVKNLWTGPTKNFIDVANIATRWGDIFLSFKSVVPWTTDPAIDAILKGDIIALGEVDPRGIGGSSKAQHFVLITGKAPNGHAIIYEPWRGVEESVDIHFANYGGIKSLRLFTVKPHTEPPAPPTPPSGELTYDQKMALEQVQVVKDQEGFGNLESAARAMKDSRKDLIDANIKILKAKEALS